MIYFIRHGESEANLKHVFAGQKDNSPLTEKGIEQAKAEGLKIKEMGLKIDKIISSPLIRAFDTAKIVAEIIGYDKEIEIDTRITEYDMGTLTGTPTFEISSKILVRAENAENPKYFDDRVNSFLKEWNKYDGNVLMVAHAGVGRIIETIKKGTDPELFYDLPPYPNASVIKLDWIK
jgi:broad specificity phosphatase PhoE